MCDFFLEVLLVPKFGVLYFWYFLAQVYNFYPFWYFLRFILNFILIFSPKKAHFFTIEGTLNLIKRVKGVKKGTLYTFPKSTLVGLFRPQILYPHDHYPKSYENLRLFSRYLPSLIFWFPHVEFSTKCFFVCFILETHKMSESLLFAVRFF